LGYDCTGPHPPDAIFIRGLRGEFDLIVAMYHDQGHIPMKLIDFEGTVNISLGIPIIRTSVDHGTAFDIAGQGRANPQNMKSAMRMAVRMATGKLNRAAALVAQEAR
jgi:4-hydroxythreonine-4-phosphate dehydrogenase